MADEKRKWSKREIEELIENVVENIVDKKLSEMNLDNPHTKTVDVKQSPEYQELMHEYNICKQENDGLHKQIDELNKIQQDYNKLVNEKSDLENELNEVHKELNKYNSEFCSLLDLFNYLSSLSDKSVSVLKRFINSSTPMELVFSVINEQNIKNFYEYILYDMNNLSAEVFEVYNRILSFLCSANHDYILVDCNGTINDNEHIEVNNKHYGEIKKVIVNGYKYRISGNVVKKAIVEV